MAERQVELVALESQVVASRRALSPLQDCPGDRVRVVAQNHRRNRRWRHHRLSRRVVV